MDGKHTPGPWTVVPYGDGDSLVIHSGDEWRICFMATPGESPGAMEKIEANAALIAAAPKMLEALEQIAALMSSGPRATDIAEEAISLARGEGLEASRAGGEG